MSFDRKKHEEFFKMLNSPRVIREHYAAYVTGVTDGEIKGCLWGMCIGVAMALVITFLGKIL